MFFVLKNENKESTEKTFRSCLVGRKFYVFSIQTFRK